MTATRRVHHTFGKRTTVGALSFGSQAEARYHAELVLRVAAGQVLYFHRQVPIDLGGGVVYRCDFQEFHASGEVHYVDVKGKRTPLTREHDLKARLVSDRYPFDIEIARR
jgi:hypothetical protein